MSSTSISLNAVQAAVPPVPLEISKKKEEEARIAHRSLLVAATVCSILSVIPPLRLAGSLALRGVALLSSSTTAATRWSEESLAGKMAKIAKVAAVALGLIALAAALPALMAVSIGVDLGVQVSEFVKAAHEGRGAQAFIHLALAIVDTLLLAGIVVGSWELMVASISINIALMAGAAIISAANVKKGEDVIDVMCYTALAATGIAGAVTMAPKTDKHFMSRFSGKNDTKNVMTFYDRDNKAIITVQPGESYDFAVKDTSLFKYEYAEVVSSTTEKTRMYPVDVERVIEVLEPPLDTKYFGTLPVGGPSSIIEVKEPDND